MQSLVSAGFGRHKYSLIPVSRSRISSRQKTVCSLRKTWPSLSASLFSTGFVLGPLIDGLHSRVSLVVYQNGAFNLGPLHTDIFVPPLLGLFYVSVGLLGVVLDRKLSTNEGGEDRVISPDKAAASLIAVVLFVELSAEMYKAGIPDNVESCILFLAAEVVWLLFDGTRLGFALACLIGILCPVAEVPLMQLFGLWYYPEANIDVFGQGLVSWTMTCYFVYTTFLLNLGRWIHGVGARKTSRLG